MQKLTETIVERAPWAAGQTRTIDIDLAGYITEIIFKLSLRITGASAVTALEDGLMRIIRGLRFTASNVKDWYAVRDGREGYYLSFLKQQGLVFISALPVAGVTQTVELQFAFHPGVLPGNMFDITRCVPLRGKSNVQVEIDWGIATDLGVGFTIVDPHADTTGLEVEVSRVVLEKGESEADAFAPLDHIFVPRLIPVLHSIVDACLAFSFSRDVPTGAYVRDVALLVLSAADIRSNVDVTQFRVANNKGGLFHVRRNWATYTREVRARYYLTPVPVVGLGIIDFRNVSGKDYGLNMVQASKGDWMIDYSTIAGGQIRALFEGADLVSVDPTEVGTGVR